MCKRIIILFFTVFLAAISTASIYADSTDTGWKGYGLYNLSKSEVVIDNETDNVTVTGGNIAAVYEYSITNVSSKDITVNFGYPDNGIYKFSVYDGSKYIKYKTRMTSYLLENYGVSGLQTPDGRWYLFTMVFTPGQTRTIKVNIEAEMTKAADAAYPLSFFKDRSFSYAITGKAVKLSAKINDFKPYSIVGLEGIEPGSLSKNGTIELNYDESKKNGFSINYQPVDKMAIDRLNASEYKKPKAIAKAFFSKDYNTAIALCDEYINTPADSKLSIEQVKYIKAEANRLSGNNEEYLNNIEQVDISKLYPDRIKYKINYDKLIAYDSLNNDKAIDGILAVFLPESQKSYPYMYNWLEQNGYKLSEVKETSKSVGDTKTSQAPKEIKKSTNMSGAFSRLFNGMGSSRWLYILIGFAAGFVIGRISRKGRKKRSVYLFRD